MTKLAQAFVGCLSSSGTSPGQQNGSTPHNHAPCMHVNNFLFSTGLQDLDMFCLLRYLLWLICSVHILPLPTPCSCPIGLHHDREGMSIFMWSQQPVPQFISGSAMIGVWLCQVCEGQQMPSQDCWLC